MQTRVSVRGQTVVPRAIRAALGITRETRLQWKLRDGVIIVIPVPPDPLQASVGILRGKLSFDELLRDRNEERAAELAREKVAGLRALRLT